MTPNVLIWGDTATSPELRHEVPLAIGDPFLYLESDGRRAVVTSALEDSRIAQAVPDLERLLLDDLGRDELVAPSLGGLGSEPLIAGDVIAIEPGTVIRALGGVRVEDLMVVTDDGAESLTGTFPYALVP